MIGKIVKEMKWVMRTNESARTKRKRCHGKGIVRKLDLSQLCYSLNVLFSYVPRNFPLCFPH